MTERATMPVPTHDNRIRRALRRAKTLGLPILRLSTATGPSLRQGTKPRAVVVDTTFARLDMGAIVAARLVAFADQLTYERVTVPGFKDLAAASRRAIDQGADIVVACAMPGPEPIDESCASEASLGLQMVQALTGTPILEVFVHTTEALDTDGTVQVDLLAELCASRCEAHADNAARMVLAPTEMLQRAGTGRRQGTGDIGALITRT